MLWWKWIGLCLIARVLTGQMLIEKDGGLGGEVTSFSITLVTWFYTDSDVALQVASPVTGVFASYVGTFQCLYLLKVLLRVPALKGLVTLGHKVTVFAS